MPKTMSGQEASPEATEICARCGMVANLDPWLHTERYGHRPEVIRAGARLRFSLQTARFSERVR